ncbi:24091_t:CDS:1, partial [Gigaspora rosea]
PVILLKRQQIKFAPSPLISYEMNMDQFLIDLTGYKVTHNRLKCPIHI